MLALLLIVAAYVGWYLFESIEYGRATRSARKRAESRAAAIKAGRYPGLNWD